MDINDPPIIVSKIKNNSVLKLKELVVIPEVEIEEVTPRNIWEKPSFEIIKKYKNNVNIIIKTNKCRSS